MKALKSGLVIMAAAVLTLGLSGMAFAFHAGGVAECGGCHSMHSPAPGGSFLLVGTDQSSACLTCHERAGEFTSYHVSTADADMPAGTAPRTRTPGGDFGWLKKTYTFVQRGSTVVEEGQTHGHNIVAADKGYVADTVNTTAPGGSFPAANLACTSCHDPHGKYRRDSSGTVSNTGAPISQSGSYKGTASSPTVEPPPAGLAYGVYRLLAGNGYTKSGATFTGVPAAKAPNTYNQSEATNQVRIAYGVKTTGGHVAWGTWCGTCHGDMHSSGNYVHPVDQGLGGTVISNYNSYKKSGDMTGVPASSYWSLVPFITNSGDYAALATLSNNNAATYAGPSDGDQVSCMSCHRAHATGFPEMLRWDMETTFVVQNGVYGGTTRGRTADEAKAAYYDRDATFFATYQRVLCNKCHAQD